MEPKNVAIGCTATASHFMLSFVPARAFDNSTGAMNRWESGIVTGTHPWLMADLRDPYFVNRFVIRSIATGGWPSNYANQEVKIEYSMDYTNWTLAADLQNQGPIIDYTAPAGFFCRCVRATFMQGIQVNTSCAAVEEFEIYSCDCPYPRNLFISSGTLSPAFSYNVLDYTAAVDSSVSSITVWASTFSDTATVTVNNIAVQAGWESAPINLNYGTNTPITVSVTDGAATQNYTITVTRADIPNLTNLTLNDGTKNLAFIPQTFDGTQSGTYTAYTGFDTKSIDVTPAAADPNAVVQVNGTSLTSGPAAVPFTGQTGTITVTSSANTRTLTFTINLTRSSNPYMSDIKGLSNLRSFSPKPFSGTMFEYTCSIAAASVNVKPVAADPTAQILVTWPGGSQQVNSNSTVAVQLPNSEPSAQNDVTFKVISATGMDSRLYTVSVTRTAESILFG